MICRTAVQDHLKIRLAALVELPFKNSGCCYALVRYSACKGLRISAAL
jgi:hypothetical protein